MRFHDLRHAYATWLVTDGVPINLVQRVVGYEQASTTLNRYTQTPDDYATRVPNAFTLPTDDLLTTARETPSAGSLDEDEGGVVTWAAVLIPERDDPRRGETGVVGRFGSGGVEPNQLSGHGGCNR
ncbi:tyrosine-type recombinase/integrase [Micromonospora musae]|uniref:tyrosine-type recombinase/integrase n=1 Tax=Micromonospora musae TaxID=1894970 RepID=UPI0034410E78